MKFTVGIKILLGFGMALLILVIVGGVSYHNTLNLIENTNTRSQTYQVLASLKSIIAELTNAETGQRGYVLTGRDSYLEPFRKAAKDVETAITELRDLTADNPKQQEILEKIRPFVAEKMAELQQTIDLRTEKGFDTALKVVLTDKGKNAMDQIRAFVTQMEATENRLLDERNVESANSAQATKSTIIYGTIIAFVLVGISGTLIQRSITVPLGNFVAFVDRVGKGDLTQQAVVVSNDEVGVLGNGMNLMVAGLKNVNGQIASVTENMNAASAQILASAKQQASSTKEQAATVQEITSTMQEISQSGSQIVAKAKEVAGVAEQATSASASGMNAVQNTNRTMEAIREQVEEVAENIVALSEKTQAVGEIISTVNEIAEQSNLLALNATIEAADAGDEGCRFSVVASEMKNLADQAKECTVHVRKILGEIQKAINTSVMLTEEAVKRVESGKQQAEVSENVIRLISSSTEESIQAFQQIIGATNQQQVGLEQVAQGMKDIDLAAQQNATGTGQLEQAVVSLSAMSRQLQTAVACYKV
jgi:methyl-accepting chemotaxis protein